MKRKDLIKRCEAIAAANGHTFEVAREGANHTVFVLHASRIPIPRHREIGEGLARKIQAQAWAAATKER